MILLNILESAQLADIAVPLRLHWKSIQILLPSCLANPCLRLSKGDMILIELVDGVPKLSTKCALVLSSELLESYTAIDNRSNNSRHYEEMNAISKEYLKAHDHDADRTSRPWRPTNRLHNQCSTFI
jgi:hypothetical protein